ncbi:MAG: hypothetical protein HQK89_04360 [Nitrospirae bacterium]|nr:hypothetical protein [Nitrospirota bacterium]
MKVRDMSITWKTAIPVIVLIVVLFAVVIVVSGNRVRAIVTDEAKMMAIACYRDTILNALTTMMINR